MTDQQEHNRMWLNNHVNHHHLGEITYTDNFQQHEQSWISTVELNGTAIGEGQAATKKGAREDAARRALEHLQREDAARRALEHLQREHGN